MTEADELLAAWKRTYGEMNRRREPDAMRYEDSTLALGVTLMHEFRALIEQEIAAVSKTGSVSNLRPRVLNALAKYNPKDAE